MTYFEGVRQNHPVEPYPFSYVVVFKSTISLCQGRAHVPLPQDCFDLFYAYFILFYCIDFFFCKLPCVILLDGWVIS